jgi:hypothetical protein
MCKTIPFDWHKHVYYLRHSIYIFYFRSLEEKSSFTWAIVFVRACTGGVPPVLLCRCQGCHGTSCQSCGLDNIYIYLYRRPSRPHMLMW